MVRASISILALILLITGIASGEDVASFLRQKETERNTLFATMPDYTMMQSPDAHIRALRRMHEALKGIVEKTDDTLSDKVVADVMANPAKNQAFERDYFQVYVEKLVRKGDIKKLRPIFSKFNSLLDGDRVDISLAYSAADGILLYFDFCETSDAAPSERPYVLRLRLQNLREDFPAISKKQSLDANFLKEARAWYVANKSHLQINPDYIGSLPPQGFSGGPGAELGLFIPQSPDGVTRLH